MTVARRTKRRTRLEKQTQEVIGDLLDGMSQANVARKYAVATSSVSDFAVRHGEEINRRAEAVETDSAVHQISSKVWRIGENQELYSLAKAEVTTAETTSERLAAINTASARLRQVAEELGALPRPDQNVNIRAQLLVREYKGANPEDVG